MSGTKQGGVKTRETNLKKFGENYYKDIGKLGGSVKVPKGFAVTGKASEAGAKGGRISRRGKVKHESDDMWPEVFSVEMPEKKSLWQRIKGE